MNQLPKWMLDMGVEIETESKDVKQKDTNFEKLVEESFAKEAKAKQYKEDKNKGLTHKPFAKLKEAA